MSVPAAPAAAPNFLDKLFAGGFLKGYRTYVLGVVAIIGYLSAWIVGDQTLPAVLSAHWQDILVVLGLATAANH